MSRPFIPAPNTASVELIYSYHTIVCENIFHVQKGSPFTLSELQALRGSIITWYTNTWRGTISSDCQLVRVRTKALDSGASPMEDFAVTPSINGAVVTASAPNSITFAIKLSTGLTGRSQRGRWYVVGVPGTAVVTGIDIATGSANAWVAALNTLIANLTSNSTPMVVTSFQHNKAWRAVANNTVVTTAVAVDFHLDNQRRRLAGRGQ